MTLKMPKQWEPLAVIPIVAGMFWLLASYGGGWILWGLVPGALMLATGVALLLWPGDSRITEYMAAGGLIGIVFALPLLLFGDAGDAALAALAALASYLTAGQVALSREPVAEGADAPGGGLGIAAKAALDEALLAYFVGTARIPSGEQAERVCAEAGRMEEALTTLGWLDNPEGLHRLPPSPDAAHVRIHDGRIYGRDYERLVFESGFVPDARLPGAAAWEQHEENRQFNAWILRHPGPPRPWLCCIHGYRMGEPWLDFMLFPPRWLHDRLGLNLIMPVLPLHGPRRTGLRSGDQYLDGDPLDLLFAQTQALWDLRRALAWVRTQEDDARIGVLGYSLGGYNAGLLVQYESGLDFAVAGIPAVDFAAALWRHIPHQHRDYYQAHGLTPERYRRLLGPVSPLALPPRIPADRLYIFAGAADRVVLPEQPVALAAHWRVPVQWYQGGHLTFRGERVVRAHVEAAIHRAGWPAPERTPAPQPGDGEPAP